MSIPSTVSNFNTVHFKQEVPILAELICANLSINSRASRFLSPKKKKQWSAVHKIATSIGNKIKRKRHTANPQKRANHVVFALTGTRLPFVSVFPFLSKPLYV